MSKKQAKTEANYIIKLFRFLTSRTFLNNLLLIILVMVVLLVGLNFFLKAYTNHGQKLTLPNFDDMHLTDARKLAEDKSFQIIVNDSTHIVGLPGGMIINQNPRANAEVKENRKVYVTVTKYQSDMIRLESLPQLYGREYEQKRKELSHMKINSRVKEYAYDRGEPDHILEVYYNNDKIIDADGRKEGVRIEKGGTLDFILSKRSGLPISIPDLRCQTLAAAEFMIQDGLRLKMGRITEEGDIDDPSEAYVISQYPPYDPEATMLVGDVIDLVVSMDKPDDCN